MFEIRFIARNIIDYLSNTQFCQYLTDLFSSREDLPSSETTDKNGSVSEIKTEEKTISGESRKNSRIAE
jgi:hypothetical protein